MPPPRAAIPYVERYLSEARPLLVRRAPGHDEGRLLLTERGTPLRPIYVHDLVAAVGARVGLKVHPHSLRHALASHLVAADVSIAVVKELLGHVRLATTRKYVAFERAALRRAVTLLEADGVIRSQR